MYICRKCWYSIHIGNRQHEYKEEEALMAQKQTAGRDHLGKLAPQFAALNDDVLFGEVWAREEQLSARDRSMITIALFSRRGCTLN